MNLLSNKIFYKKKKLNLTFCQRNIDQFLDKDTMPLYVAFFNEKNVNMKEYNCLSECEECKKRPYAKVNGEIVSAENSLELLNKLKRKQP